MAEHTKLRIQDLAKIREKTKAMMTIREGQGRARVTVHMGTCGIAAGARDIMDALLDEIAKSKVQDVIVTTSGCAGLCNKEPMATVELKDQPPVKYGDLTGEGAAEGSEAIRSRVEKARAVQRRRFERSRIHRNADMGPSLLRRHCALDQAGKDVLQAAMNELGFSARGYDKVLKVARTIADLAGDEHVQAHHLQEAVQYRNLDRQLWI